MRLLKLCLNTKLGEKRKEGEGKRRKERKGSEREGKDSIVCIGNKKREKKIISLCFQIFPLTERYKC